MYMYKIILKYQTITCIFHSDFDYVTLQADSEGPRSERANSASRGGKAMGGGMDMMAEMQRKLAARCASIQSRLLTKFDYLILSYLQMPSLFLMEHRSLTDPTEYCRVTTPTLPLFCTSNGVKSLAISCASPVGSNLVDSVPHT